MAANRAFCSQHSREVNEQRFGSASRGTLWLLLEHPGPWGLHPPYDTPLPAHVRQYLVRFLEQFETARLLLIKREPSGAARTLFLALSRESEPELHRFSLSSYDDLPDLEMDALAGGYGRRPSIREQPLFLVCTDGKHDHCCAKFGLPIYRALRAVAGEKAWQASHVGGDRFAANVVCFPHGFFFGHVAPEDIGPLVDSCGLGHVYLPKYRGRACYPFELQAAEYFIRTETGITRADGLRLVRRRRMDNDTWTAEFVSRPHGRLHQVTLRREESTFESYLNCTARYIKRVPQYRLLAYSTQIANLTGGKNGYRTETTEGR